MTWVQFGWLIRVHPFLGGINLMIFTAFMHACSVLPVPARLPAKPRGLTWVSGMILRFLVLGFGFSGYLLPWNTLAFFATKVGTEITGQVPLIGHTMMVLMRGGEEVTGATLTRFFGVHVAVLPGLSGFSDSDSSGAGPKICGEPPPSVEARVKVNPAVVREMKFLPNFLLREVMAWYFASVGF